MIERLRHHAARVGVTNLVGIVGDASSTVPPGQFDIVILAHVLGEISDQDATLAGCFRALKGGGVLSVSEIVLDPHFVSQRAVTVLARRAGFANVARPTDPRFHLPRISDDCRID